LKSLGWLIVLFILLLLSAPADAQQLEFSLGATAYGFRNGVWCQRDYEDYYCDNHLTGNSQMLSLRIPKWRVSLVHMGEVHNSAMWGKYELVDELKGNYPRCDAGPKNECFYGHGYGDVWGASLGRVFEWGSIWEAELGAFLYQAKWHEEGTGPTGFWAFDKTHAYEGGYPSKTSPVGNGWSSETHMTYYLGATAHYKRLFGTFRYYGNVRDGNGLMGQMAKQVMVGMTFPLEGK